MSRHVAAWPGLVHMAAQVSKTSKKASPEASSLLRSLLAPSLLGTIGHMTKPKVGVRRVLPKGMSMGQTYKTQQA